MMAYIMTTWRRLTFLAILLTLYIIRVSARQVYWPNSLSQYITIDNKNVEINDCSDSSFVLEIDHIDIKPDLVVPGGDVIIQANGTLSTPVLPGAMADVAVKLGAIRLLHKSFDICKELEDNKDKVELQCPIQDGYLTVTQKITLPKEIPRGKFSVLINAYTSNDEDLACLRISIDFRRRRKLWQISY
ncbi:ML domain-containing protein [Cokeromyces recurvatus]|uniref:ML domain-containing protein n=1 Tax=Cokeromyces recurvatus TaxID=90255 RepID=UPI00221E9037|nr:ML domain-containing protein [Cokeromyces recurvatus]KAI7899971.1 ML domain-containing protein [Cokeromyces recurvatus]